MEYFNNFNNIRKKQVGTKYVYLWYIIKAMKTQFKSFPEVVTYFDTEEKCKKLLALQRWPNGNPVCPHCNSAEHKVYVTNRGYKCGNKACLKKFTITSGTIFDNTKVSLRIWFFAIYLCTNHKKGVSSHQLARDLNVSQKTAWFILHRIREMVVEKNPSLLEGTIEVDETYVGGKAKNKHAKERKKLKGTGYKGKSMVFGLLERDGKVHTQVVPSNDGSELKPIINERVENGSTVMTDGFGAYYGLNKNFHHEVVNHHQGEYVRGIYHTNTIEGYFSQLKRGIFGIYHHVSVKHLNRYCNEFSYRYNTRKEEDCNRFVEVLRNAANAHITYVELTK